MWWGHHFIPSSWNRRGHFSDKIKACSHPAEVVSDWVLEKVCSVPSECGAGDCEQCPSSPAGHEIWSLASADAEFDGHPTVCHPSAGTGRT